MVMLLLLLLMMIGTAVTAAAVVVNALDLALGRMLLYDGAVGVNKLNRARCRLLQHVSPIARSRCCFLLQLRSLWQIGGQLLQRLLLQYIFRCAAGSQFVQLIGRQLLLLFAIDILLLLLWDRSNGQASGSAVVLLNKFGFDACFVCCLLRGDESL